MSWAAFAAAAPDLAAAVLERFAIRKHATMATVRRDGSPRISGTEVSFDGGEVRLGSMPDAVKALDLRRDPRVAIHSPTVDPASPSEWAGEAKLAGVVVEEESWRFRVDVTEVVLTALGDPPDHLVVTWWTSHGGLRRVERR